MSTGAYTDTIGRAHVTSASTPNGVTHRALSAPQFSERAPAPRSRPEKHPHIAN